MTSDTQALGEAIEQTTSYTRVSTSNLVETATDELGRGHPLSPTTARATSPRVTRLYGTADAVTTTYTSRADVQPADVGHRSAEPHHDVRLRQPGADPVVDRPAEPPDDVRHNTAGQVVSVTDPLSKVTEFGYAVATW